MLELYKKVAHDAFELCCELKSNEPWVWEKTYADLVIKECIRIIKYRMTSDATNSEKYIRSFHHIADIETAFGIKKD